MNDTPDHDGDLERALRRADPSGALPPLDPEQRNRLLEDAMTQDTRTPNTDTATQAASRHRRRNTLIGIAAAVVIVGGGVGWALTAGGGGSQPQAQPTHLTMTAVGPMDMCAMVTPESLAQNTTAFEGTVTSIDDGIVTLRTTHVFRGQVAETVTVQQGGEAPIDGAPVRFSAGTTYLIAAGPDGVVGGCSGSGPTTPDLRTMFDQAFAG